MSQLSFNICAKCHISYW